MLILYYIKNGGDDINAENLKEWVEFVCKCLQDEHSSQNSVGTCEEF